MMPAESFLRRTLWAACGFNLGGAAIFAFPESPLGRLAALPPQAPLVYRAFVALFVLLFAGAYAWAAMREPLERTLIAFGAIGKTAAFALTVALWLAHAVPAASVAAVSGDAVFALLFASGLARTAAPRPS